MEVVHKLNDAVLFLQKLFVHQTEWIKNPFYGIEEIDILQKKKNQMLFLQVEKIMLIWSNGLANFLICWPL